MGFRGTAPIVTHPAFSLAAWQRAFPVHRARPNLHPEPCRNTVRSESAGAHDRGGRGSRLACVESPNKARIQQLSDKLAGLQQGLEDEKMQRVDTIEQRLHVLDEKLIRASQADDKKFKMLKDAVGKLTDSLENEKRAREALAESKAKELQIADSRLQLALEVEVQTRKEAEARVLRALEEKTNAIRVEIARETKLREEMEHRHVRLAGKETGKGVLGWARGFALSLTCWLA